MHCSVCFFYTQGMITLHSATEGTRTILKWTSIISGSVLLLVFLYQGGVNVKEMLYPTPKPPPTVSFGKLPKVAFPPSVTQKTFDFSLDTLTGTLPQFSDRIEVYKLTSQEPNLLALQTAKEKVSSVGFSEEPTKLSSTLYQWNDQSEINRKLNLDILTFDFDISSSFYTNDLVLKAQNLANEQQAIQIAQDFLSKLIHLDDLDTSKTKTTLLTINNGALAQATSFSSTNIIRIDYYQKNVNNLPIFYAHPPYSTMNFFIGGGETDPQIIQSHFYHQVITNEQSTYPIKTADEAFDELKKGHAYIASFFPNGGSVSLKNIFLGYYLGDIKQNYLMPIIIFEGDHGFYAYVSAIKDTWIENGVRD